MTAVQWISVEDKLPEAHRLVLAWDGENREKLLAAYQEGGQWCGIEVQADSNITHWMPLPEPPGEA